MGKKTDNATVTKEPVQLESLLSIPRVMQILGLGRDAVYKAIHEDGLPTLKIGERRLVRPSSLDAWIKQREQSTLRSSVNISNEEMP